jgi:ribosomal 50S subunit-associated protein YjgA (DUF615 family)
VLLDGLVDEQAVRLKLRNAADEAARNEPSRLNRKLNGIVMKTELGCDGADLPVFGEE